MPNYPGSLGTQVNKRQTARDGSPEIESPDKQTNIKQKSRIDSGQILSSSDQVNKRQTDRENSPSKNSLSMQQNKRQRSLKNSPSNESSSNQTSKRQQEWKDSVALQSVYDQVDKRQTARENSYNIQSSSIQTDKRQKDLKNSSNLISSEIQINKKQQSRPNSTGAQSSSIQTNKRQASRSNSPIMQSYANQKKYKENDVRANNPGSVGSSAVLNSIKKETRKNNNLNNKAAAKQESKRETYRGNTFLKETTGSNGNTVYRQKFGIHDAATQSNKSPDIQESKKQKPRERKAEAAIFGNNLSKMNDVLWANSIYNRQDIQWYRKFNRFGALDPYNALSGTREYIFFTKPDLHLVTPKTTNLNPELSNQPFFVELHNRYSSVISQLQSSSGYGNYNPFMTILSNAVKNTLEIPSISTNTVDTPATIYGTSYNYRGWGFSSDEKIEFSLEFEDSKYLEIYNLVKAYEEYERLKHIGLVTPPNITGGFNYYIQNKILHDQFSVYKFIVEDDGETILYYAKLWGVFFKNVPRDSFSDMKVEGGLTYAIDFEAAFIDDMNPTILTDFNQIVEPYVNRYKNNLPIYNIGKRMIDGRWASLPIIAKQSNKGNKSWNGPTDMAHSYKLKWRV